MTLKVQHTRTCKGMFVTEYIWQEGSPGSSYKRTRDCIEGSRNTFTKISAVKGLYNIK